MLMMMQRCQSVKALTTTTTQSFLTRNVHHKRGYLNGPIVINNYNRHGNVIHSIPLPFLPTTKWFSTSSASSSEDSTSAPTNTSESPKKKVSPSAASVAAASLAARDVRLAGRRRFYRNVDVSPVSAPWEPEHHLYHKMAPTTVQSWLQPRLPGTTTSNSTNDDDNTTTTTTTSINSSCCWYNVTLDGKMVRTPMGQVLAVPSLSLAHCLAVEWDQQSSRIQPAQMPLMTLVCTALDQVVMQATTFQQHSLNYLWTDTVCFYADPVEDRVLHQRQERAWKPIHAHVQDVWNCTPATVVGTNQTLVTTRRSRVEVSNVVVNGVNGHDDDANANNNKVSPPHISLGLPHPPQLVEQATALCHSLDAWHLAALHSVAAEAKSFLVASYMIQQRQHHSLTPPSTVFAAEQAVMDDPSQTTTRPRARRSSRSKKQLPIVQTAIDAARVEEEFQIDNWGLVEGGHDYDRLNCSIRIRAAQVLLQSLALNHMW